MSVPRPKKYCTPSPVTCPWRLKMIDAARAGAMDALVRLYEGMLAEGYPISVAQGALSSAASLLPIQKMTEAIPCSAVSAELAHQERLSAQHRAAEAKAKRYGRNG